MPDFQFSDEWQLLGPFQIGTREAVWGADPLEYLGGFRALSYNDSATFKSSLPFNGTVSWSTIKAIVSPPEFTSRSAATLHVSYPEVDWTSLQQVYGWAALQWQGWARGSIYVQSKGTKVLSLNVEQILEFWIDDIHYFGGDFYSFGRAAVTLRLEPGVHRIDARLVRDVRAMGGVGEPSIDVTLELIEQDSAKPLTHVRASNGDPYGGVLISDVVGGEFGRLASPYASAYFRNDGLEDIVVIDVEGVGSSKHTCLFELVSSTPFRIRPGQTRPFAFKVACVPPVTWELPIEMTFRYRIDGRADEKTLDISSWPAQRGSHEPQKVTHLHPGGMVSYFILRPPSVEARCANDSSPAPVLLQLHGAGLEAEDELVRRALDPLPDLCAWVVFPTGVTPWSGDDWHNWGFADVEAAVSAIPAWIEQMGWKGVGVDVDRWLVSGHSNGGQGTWYTLTHRPDKVIAAAPISGYSSIQNYVPYSLWHTMDASKLGVIDGALHSYRHELLLPNTKGIPTLQQHGSADDNVPPYHSRLLSQRLQEVGSASEYVEMKGKPHWWEGVMTTPHLSQFYKKHLNDVAPRHKAVSELEDFTLVSPGHGDLGSKHGVQILEVTTPGQIGKLQVHFDHLTSTCNLRLTNVRTLSLSSLYRDCNLIANGQNMYNDSVSSPTDADMILSNDKGEWSLNTILPPIPPRRGRQQGPMDSILRTPGAFQIVSPSNKTDHIALQISRNLHQYYAADTVITPSFSSALSATGNIITLSLASHLAPPVQGYDYPICIHNDQIEISECYSSNARLHKYKATTEYGLAALFLRPLPSERLELVVWGVDEESLGWTTRLVPLLTGSGVPEFVVLDRRMLWEGVEGVLAMGRLGANWEVGRASFFT